MVIGLVILIVLFSLVLIKSAEMVVVALRRLGDILGFGTFALSAIILALGTSFPELFVGITSALEGRSNLALGVVLGSNIANIALVGALTAFVVGRVRVSPNYLKRDVWLAFAAGLVPLFLVMIDKDLNRVDGLILITIYLGYTTSFFRKRFIQVGEEQKEEGFIYRFMQRLNHPVDGRKTKEFGRLFLGIALLLFSADIIVNLSSTLAGIAKIPIFLVGLFILAIGTSLPEFALSLRSLEDREPSMFFGNILGSVIANSSLIIGVTALIQPIEIVAFDEYMTAVVMFILVFAFFWFFIRSKHRLDRWEAFFLLVLYLIFVVVEFS